MGQLTLSENVLSLLDEIAREENRPAEAIVEGLVTQYAREQAEHRAQYEAAMRELRPKLYKIAREYWEKVGDAERLALTDSELDEQFWLIDQDGVPRLKSDQGKVVVQENPLLSLVGLLDDGPGNLSDPELIDRTVRDHYKRKFGRSG